MVQLLTLLDTIFDDKLVPCHLIILRTLHTVAKVLGMEFLNDIVGRRFRITDRVFNHETCKLKILLNT